MESSDLFTKKNHMVPLLVSIGLVMLLGISFASISRSKMNEDKKVYAAAKQRLFDQKTLYSLEASYREAQEKGSHSLKKFNSSHFQQKLNSHTFEQFVMRLQKQNKISAIHMRVSQVKIAHEDPLINQQHITLHVRCKNEHAFKYLVEKIHQEMPGSVQLLTIQQEYEAIERNLKKKGKPKPVKFDSGLQVAYVLTLLWSYRPSEM